MLKKATIIFASIICSAIGNGLSITLENDLLFQTDCYYTHGTRFIYTPDKVPEWVNNLFSAQRYSQVHHTLAQHMYTPSDLKKEELIVDDRPYGGWLYYGYGISSQKDKWLDVIEIDIGTTGEWSFSEDVQKCIHKLTDSTMPRGWDNQIKSEMGVDLSYEKKYKFYRDDFIDFDLIPSAGFCAGNIFTLASCGLSSRIGYNIPNDFGYVKMEPTPRKSFKKDFSLYLSAGVEERYIVRNIFLDGNTFRDSHSVAKNDWVTDIIYGIGCGYGNFSIIMVDTYRTQEFETQKENAKFTTLIFSWKI